MGSQPPPHAVLAAFGVAGRRKAARRPSPVTAPSQLIHGDLSGNVLFHAELPPAIIDFAACWRPVAFASAIVVADALVWEGAEVAQQVRRRLDYMASDGISA